MTPTRRDFLKTTAASAAIITARSRERILGANDRIRVGMIGVGGMGSGHLRRMVERADEYGCDVVAVCDVYRKRLDEAQETCGGDAYMDYRELLDRQDIDAVFIVTPDHWHAKMSIEAVDAGKHVYCEKPMTLTVEQALEVRNFVRASDRVFQVGANRTAQDKYWKAGDLIRSGRVGQVTWAQAGYNRNVKGGAFNKWFPIDESAGPDQSGEDYIDWDMWLGHEWNLAPEISWNPEHFFRFRKYWPYNGGVATDLLYHMLAPLLISITGPDGEYPYRVTANGGLYILKDGRDIPDVFTMNVAYRSDFNVNLTSMLTNNTPVPIQIFGQYGTIDLDVSRVDGSFGSGPGGVIATGNGDFVEDFRKLNDGYSRIEIAAEERPDLKANFFQVIRHGGDTFCNVDLGAATMVAIKMGVEAYRQGKTLEWDLEKEQIVG